MQLLQYHRFMHRTLWLCLILLPIALPGCAQVAGLIYAVKGNTRPAEYKGLSGKNVAIVCGAETGLRTDESANMLCLFVQTTLEREVKGIKFVQREEIAQWINDNDKESVDYLSMGKKVGAEQLLKIDLKNVKMREGTTLYRGTADIAVTVYDVSSGKAVYHKELPQFAYPKVASASVMDTSEAKFRGAFISMAAQKISSLFYAADATSEYALDATVSSF